MQQRDPGWESNPGPLQSLSTWVARATNRAKRCAQMYLFLYFPHTCLHAFLLYYTMRGLSLTVCFLDELQPTIT